MFWFFDHEACGILAPWPRIEPSPPALEDEALTTGPPPKSLGHTILMAWTCSVPLCLVKQWLYSFLLHSEFCLWDLIRCWCTEAEFLASHFFFLNPGKQSSSTNWSWQSHLKAETPQVCKVHIDIQVSLQTQRSHNFPSRVEKASFFPFTHRDLMKVPESPARSFAFQRHKKRNTHSF